MKQETELQQGIRIVTGAWLVTVGVLKGLMQLILVVML